MKIGAYCPHRMVVPITKCRRCGDWTETGDVCSRCHIERIQKKRAALEARYPHKSKAEIEFILHHDDFFDLEWWDELDD